MFLSRLFLCVLVFLPFALTVLDDSILYNLNWPGKSVDLKKGSSLLYNDEDAVIIKTKNNEKYKCMIPSSTQDKPTEEEFSNAASPVVLLSPLLKKKLCVYRLEAYWTYEICHGKHIRQYHEEKAAGGKVNLQEFYLGYFSEEPDENGIFSTLGEVPTKSEDVPNKKIDGSPTPYYALDMSNGTPCALKGGAKRYTRVFYVCHPESRNEISSISETSSCEYEMVILTPALCQNPFYKVKGSPVNEVYCQALDDSPRKPRALVNDLLEVEEETRRFSPRKKLRNEEEGHFADADPNKNDYRRVEDTGISKQTDKALLKQFLTGEFCLKGGSGWWFYEYCYGKHVVQYHDDKLEGRTVINVGKWDLAAHLEWAKTSQPRLYTTEVDPETNKKKVRLVQHFYTGGDFCEAINKPRQVIVKLKCKKSSSAHSVTIYLLEPSTCSYILGVESPIICDLLETADENGLFVDT